MAEGIKICPADDPNRCQGVTAFGQCNKYALPGSDRCKMHAGAEANKNKQAVNGYLLSRWQCRLDRLADANGVRSLRTEIGVLKMTLEALVQRCENEEHLIEASSKIGDLVLKIEKVVHSCSKLERTTGMMLDKSAALQIVGNIVGIISNHIEDSEVVSNIADEIIKQVLNVEVQDE